MRARAPHMTHTQPQTRRPPWPLRRHDVCHGQRTPQAGPARAAKAPRPLLRKHAVRPLRRTARAAGQRATTDSASRAPAAAQHCSPPAAQLLRRLRGGGRGGADRSYCMLREATRPHHDCRLHLCHFKRSRRRAARRGGVTRGSLRRTCPLDPGLTRQASARGRAPRPREPRILDGSPPAPGDSPRGWHTAVGF